VNSVTSYIFSVSLTKQCDTCAKHDDTYGCIMPTCIYCIHNPKAHSLRDHWTPKKPAQQQKQKMSRKRKEASLQ
jgi:hypothetical protein